MAIVSLSFDRAAHSEWDGDDQIVEISVNATAGRPGRYSGPPERCYPDEPAEWDISSIVGADTGEAVELTEVEIDVLSAMIEESIDDLLAEQEDGFNEPDECDDRDYGNYDINGAY